jgi:hypothetical protein
MEVTIIESFFWPEKSSNLNRQIPKSLGLIKHELYLHIVITWIMNFFIVHSLLHIKTEQTQKIQIE